MEPKGAPLTTMAALRSECTLADLHEMHDVLEVLESLDREVARARADKAK